MNNTKKFKCQTYARTTSALALGLTFFIQSCSNTDATSNMQEGIETFEKESTTLLNAKTIELNNNSNDSSMFSCVKNLCKKLNPFAENIDQRSRVILGCGQNLDTKKHNHKGHWTVSPDKVINPDYIGYAEDALTELNDNFCISILSEYLPMNAFTPNLFELISKKLKKGGELTILGNLNIMIGKNRTLLICDVKNDSIKTVDFSKEFDGENLRRDNPSSEIGNASLGKLIDALEETDHIENSINNPAAEQRGM